MQSPHEHTFGDLPQALINELLNRSNIISDLAAQRVEKLATEQNTLREKALQLGIIQKEKIKPQKPNTRVAAVDGSIASIRLTAFDLNAAAALLVDGLGEESNHEIPNYNFDLHITEPNQYAQEMIYALMFCMEYELAHTAQHNLVMLDGAFSSGMVAISIGLKSATQRTDNLSDALIKRWSESVVSIIPQIMQSNSIVALPKRSSANEFMTQTPLFEGKESNATGRLIATSILQEGEFTIPFKLETHRFHIDDTNINKDYLNRLQNLYNKVNVIYFKPTQWSDALRIEFPNNSTDDAQSLHEKLIAISSQMANPAMKEPYPLYIADRFVKSLSKGVTALLDAIKPEIANKSKNYQLATKMLNPYRTDPSIEENTE